MKKQTILLCLALSGSAAFCAATADAGLVANGVVVNGDKIQKLEKKSFSDGLAVRYKLPAGKRRITGEDTVWTLPLDAKVWYQAGRGADFVDYDGEGHPRWPAHLPSDNGEAGGRHIQAHD